MTSKLLSKSSIKLFISSIIGLSLATVQVPALGQSASLSGDIHQINSDLFGYNNNNWNEGASFTDPAYRHTIGRLAPSNLRYPGGTTSNSWDWRTGNIIRYLRKGEWPQWRPVNTVNTPKMFVDGMPEGTKVIYNVNLARPTPHTGFSMEEGEASPNSYAILDAKIADILDAIKAFDDAGHALEYLELGNEFYHDAIGGTEGQGGIYTGRVDLYIEHADYAAGMIKAAYPELKIAVLGEALRAKHVKDGLDVAPWTQAIYKAKSEGKFLDIDAITMHWYAGARVGFLNGKESEAQKLRWAEKALAQTKYYFDKVERREYSRVPKDWDIWVTEYGTWENRNIVDKVTGQTRDNPIEGTWVNGLVHANIALRLAAMGPKNTLMNFHELGQGGNPQWHALHDTNTLSANGVAMSVVGKAMLNKTRVETIEFDNVKRPTVAFDFNKNGKPIAFPTLAAYKFSSANQSAVVLVNNSRTDQEGVDISGLLSGQGNRQMTQYYDKTPWNRAREGNNTIDHRFSDRAGNSITLPAFSITLITQHKENQITNGSLEQSADGWTLNNDTQIRYSRKQAGSGNKSLYMFAAQDDWQSAERTVSVSPGKRYSLTAQIKTRLNSGAGRIAVSFFDSTGQEVGQRRYSNKVVGRKAYTPTTVSFVPPRAADTARIALQLANGSGELWYDDVVLSSR